MTPTEASIGSTTPAHGGSSSESSLTHLAVRYSAPSAPYYTPPDEGYLLSHPNGEQYFDFTLLCPTIYVDYTFTSMVNGDARISCCLSTNKLQELWLLLKRTPQFGWTVPSLVQRDNERIILRYFAQRQTVHRLADLRQLVPQSPFSQERAAGSGSAAPLVPPLLDSSLPVFSDDAAFEHPHPRCSLFQPFAQGLGAGWPSVPASGTSATTISSSSSSSSSGISANNLY